MRKKRSSNREFGLVFAVVFLLVALSPLRHGRPMRWWSVSISVLFAVVTVLAPQVLAPLNSAWAKVGELLSKIVNPIVTTILYIVVVIPTGVAYRLRRKDSLRLQMEPDRDSYWNLRQPPGPAPASMTNQF